MNAAKRGFGSMSPERHAEIARRGGKSAHAMGKAHEFTSEDARAAGRKGGAATAKRSGHMAKIGRKGGLSVSSDRDHMAKIGKLGGATSRRRAG